MYGWNGRILWIDLTRRRVREADLDPAVAGKFIGGRGLAVKLLWDFLEPGTDPLSPDNLLILATGPLTGLPLPSSGKMVVASKSPLTGGYGDGNIGSMAAVMIRRAGYDAVVISGRAERETYLYIEDGRVDFRRADHLWGLDTFEAERRLRAEHGKDVGILTIGPAGENLVLFSTIISQEGRSGGRPGLGAVLGSKRLKAIVVRGSRSPRVANPIELREISAKAYRSILEKPGYKFWRRQGTMAAVQWSQENSVLPTRNFSEGVFEEAENIDGYAMERMKVGQRGCPMCNAICGNVVEDGEGLEAELDYENVALLGSNILLGDLKKVSVLNRLADMWGVDTISLGVSIGFAMEASELGLLKGYSIEWGDYEGARELAESIVYRRDVGNLLADGVKNASTALGRGAERIAMHVKGLEVTGYDCHAAPGMALAYGTSPIGAHHKDAWVISWEVKADRLAYSDGKVDKVVELQRIRGGLFEVLVGCRLPWIEIGFELDWYPKLFGAATGMDVTLDYLTREVGDRIYTLIRAFWVREAGGWTRAMDYPPPKWFEKPLTKGPFGGSKLDPDLYDAMLLRYYSRRGWDERGVPRRSTMEKLGLSAEAGQLEKILELRP